MKIKLLFLSALTLTIGAWSSLAQNFSVVGDPIGANAPVNYPAPFGNYHMGARHQFLVLSSQLLAAGVPAGAQIYSVGFNVTATNGAAAHDNFQIKVYTTSLSNLWSGWVTTNLVASTVPVTHTPFLGWNQFSFIAPFTWNGTDNLVIETCFSNSTTSVNASTEMEILSGSGTTRLTWGNQINICNSNSSIVMSLRPIMRFGWNTTNPCSGAPTPGNTVASDSVACNGKILTLDINGDLPGLGYSFNWQYSTDWGFTWNSFSTSAPPVNFTFNNQTTMFRCVVTCSNSGLSSISSAATVYSGNVCQCGNYGLSMADHITRSDIAGVEIGNIQNGSSCSMIGQGPGSMWRRYSNYTTTVPPFSATQGSFVTCNSFFISCWDSLYTNHFRVYVDWNQDGDWFDAGEEVIAPPVPLHNNSHFTSFHVPDSAALGTTRVRFVLTHMWNYFTSLSPIGTYEYGETEDYCFTVLPAGPCMGIPSLSMITASADSICGGEVITLNFTANPGTLGLTYNWEYSIDGGNTWNIFSTHPSPVYFTFNNQITQFRCVVTCTYSGDSTISNIVTVNPYTEVCNGIDDDCDYLTDDDDPSVVGIPVWYLDYDMDGYGTNSYSVVSCFAPPGYVDNNADCNDYNPNISPGAEENPCNSLDDNCNLVVDEGALPNTQLDLASCNVTVGSMSQVLRANHMASATQYEFAFFDGFNTFYELRPNRGFYFSLFSWPQYNTTYQVRVRWFNGSQWSCWGPPCQVTIGPIPTTQLQVGDCGATNVAPSQVLRADAMAGATQYEFEFYDGSQYYYELRPNRAFYFGLFWWDMFNTVYWVRVRWKTNNNIWSDWGPVCQVTTAPMPTTQLQPVDCGATVYSWTQVLRANNMAGASQYEFKVSNGTNTWYLLRPNRGFYFRLFGLPAGSFPAGSYTVEVRWKDGGTGMWSPWGPSCPITLATSLSQNISELEPSSLEVQVFPVPFDQSVFITIETSQTEPVQLEIIDLQGRLVERRVLQSDHNGLIVAGEDWAPGVYTLRAQQGIEVRTLRVVKAH